MGEQGEQVHGTVEERVAAIDAELRAIEADLQDVLGRKLKAQQRLTALSSEYAAARVERGVVLAAGGDASGITKRLKRLAEEKEAVDDEISALSPIAPDLAEKKKALRAARTTAALEVARAALRVAARRYNEKAAELVPVLQDLWDCKAAANEGGTGRVAAAPAGWDTGALASLPRLYVDEDGPPLNEVRHAGFFHADVKSYVADTAKRKLAEIDAARTEAGETVDAG